MSLFPFLGWASRRCKCAVVGHDWTSEQIYYPPAKSVIPGYRCRKCGKTQSVLYRWQTLE